MEKEKVIEILTKEKKKKEMIQRYECQIEFLEQQLKIAENTEVVIKKMDEYRNKIAELKVVSHDFIKIVDNKLPDLEYTIIFRFYVLGDTIEKIAEKIAYSSRQVSRLKNLAIGYLVENN